MSDTGNIPQSMIEAAARALWKVKAPRGRPFDELGAVGRCSMRDQATAVLAAAFAECEVREETRAVRPYVTPWIVTTNGRLLHERRLVITTPAVVVTPAQEGSDNGI